MARPVRGAALSAGLLVMTAGCGLLFDPAELSGAYGQGDGASNEARTDAPPSGPDGTATDANADAGSGIDFCKKQPSNIFCDDFDDPSPLSNRWELVAPPDAGTIALAPGQGIEGTNALRISVPKVANASATIERNFNYAAAKNVRCELDIKVEAPPQTTEHQFFNVGRGGSSDYNLQLVTKNGEWHVAEYTAQLPDGGRLDRSMKLAAAPKVGDWSRVSFRIEGNMAVVEVDGVTTSLGTIYRLPPAEDDKPWRVKVGHAFTTTQAGHTTLYENVVCTPL